MVRTDLVEHVMSAIVSAYKRDDGDTDTVSYAS